MYDAKSMTGENCYTVISIDVVSHSRLSSALFVKSLVQLIDKKFN